MNVNFYDITPAEFKELFGAKPPMTKTVVASGCKSFETASIGDTVMLNGFHVPECKIKQMGFKEIDIKQELPIIVLDKTEEDGELKWQLKEVIEDNDYYQKENKRLAEDNKALKAHCKAVDEVNEKMKCCENCDNSSYNEDRKCYVCSVSYIWCDGKKWKLK